MRKTIVAAVLALVSMLQPARGEELSRGFQNPPAAARPWVYWMWLDGNISSEGITAHLEAMKRIGIGGAMLLNLGAMGDFDRGPQTPGPVRFMTPQWRAMVRHAIAEADRLGLQIDLNNDDGWNSGGPWITAEQAMQKLTWSETRVHGPGKLSLQLPQPATTLNTYHDIAVLATASLEGVPLPAAKRTVGPGPTPWIELAFPRRVAVGSITVTATPPKPLVVRPLRCELQVSDDGRNFRSVQAFDTGWVSTLAAHETVTVGLQGVEGQFFRLLSGPKIRNATVDFSLEAETRLSYWRLKAGFDNIREHGGGAPLFAMPGDFSKLAPPECIPADKVLDLSRSLDAAGRLGWEAPPGDWLVLRLGYTPTGAHNGAATKEGRGLDCDKLSRSALEAHLAGMVDRVIADAGPLRGKSLTMLHTDSWESGPLNWTAGFAEEFQKRRGYDLLPWLPVMAGGHVLGSLEQSERFLWDLRRTLADMFIDNHLQYFRQLSHARGLKFSSESAGRQQFLYDPVSFQTTSDMPMGEFWANEKRPRPDCKAAASAAHLLDLPMVAGEAYTQFGGRWLDSPYSLKAFGDLAFCFGVNHFVFHRSVLQRWPERRPGVTWPAIGINFDPGQTWWEPAAAWMAYLARCQYLLQQGRFVADVAVLTGQGAANALIRPLAQAVDPAGPIDGSTTTEAMLRRSGQMPDLPPAGYDYDGVDTPTILNMTVSDAVLVTSHGMRYRLLVLPPDERMTLPLARKLRELVAAGATIAGPKPQGSPSLGDYGPGDVEVRAIADELWGAGPPQPAGHAFGRGRVFGRGMAGAALAAMKILPDWEYAAAAPAGAAPNLQYIHRRTKEAEVYFVSNQQQSAVAVQCTFRVSGRQPEIWMPDTGRMIPCVAYQQHDGRTTVPLQLDPSGSLFVVFRRPLPHGAAGTAAGNFPSYSPVLKVEGPWTVHFDPRWGGPPTATWQHLESWSNSGEPGVRYYSGAAGYAKSLQVDGELLQRGKRLHLDLGVVKEVAQVRLNGRDLGVLWKPPFRVDVTDALRAGQNDLEVRVTNLWPNRLIGDAALPAEKRVASVNWNPYRANSPLLESGLLGPVQIVAEKGP